LGSHLFKDSSLETGAAESSEEIELQTLSKLDKVLVEAGYNKVLITNLINFKLCGYAS
jgi:hypothetical protein